MKWFILYHNSLPNLISFHLSSYIHAFQSQFNDYLRRFNHIILDYTPVALVGTSLQGLLRGLKETRIFQPKYTKDSKLIRRSTKEHLRHFSHQIVIVEEICMEISEDGYLRKPTQWVRRATSLKSQVSDALKEQKTSRHPSFKNKELENMCDVIFKYMKECPVEDVNDKPLAFIARMHETDDENSQSDDVEKEWISFDTTGSESEPISSPDSYGFPILNSRSINRKLTLENMTAKTGEAESSHAYEASKIEDENKSKVLGEGDAPSAKRTNIMVNNSSSYSEESKHHGKGVSAGPRQADEFCFSHVDDSRLGTSIPIRGTGVMSKHVDLRLEILSVPSPQVTSSLSRHFGLSPDEDKYLLSDMKRHETADINGASTPGYVLVDRSGSKSKEMPTPDEWRQASVVNLSDKTLPLPCEEPNCPNLELLFLQRNGCLTQIPSTFFEKMPALCFLDLSDTRIKALPSSLFKLSELRVLLLRSCACLDSLPGDVKNLKRMQVLDLLGTDLDLPTEIDELGELWHLQLSYKPHKWVLSGTISKLNNLRALSIEVHSKDHHYWRADVEDMIQHVGELRLLSYLQFYFPTVECLKSFINVSLWKEKRLRRFNFIVGRNIKRIISRVPDEVESKFEQHDRCLRFINGDEVPEAMESILKLVTAFYLDHHLRIQSLSEFNISNFKELKFCVLRECPEIQNMIIGERQTEIAFPKLECLELHYLWKLEQIWPDSIPTGSFKALKDMRVSTCGQLEYIASHSTLQCLSNLETFIIEDCESLRSIVKENKTVNNEARLLPQLKKLQLCHLPKLVDLGDGLFPPEEIVSKSYCPSLIYPRATDNSRMSGRNTQDVRLQGTFEISEIDLSFKL